MNKKVYNVDYNYSEAMASFEIDLDIFTNEIANSTLEFFSWDYDKDNDPIEEVVRKYAIEAIRIATYFNYNTFGVIEEFKNNEGFCKLDGSMGIKLIDISGVSFNDLIVEIEEI